MQGFSSRTSISRPCDKVGRLLVSWRGDDSRVREQHGPREAPLKNRDAPDPGAACVANLSVRASVAFVSRRHDRLESELQERLPKRIEVLVRERMLRQGGLNRGLELRQGTHVAVPSVEQLGFTARHDGNRTRFLRTRSRALVDRGSSKPPLAPPPGMMGKSTFLEPRREPSLSRGGAFFYDSREGSGHHREPRGRGGLDRSAARGTEPRSGQAGGTANSAGPSLTFSPDSVS